MHCETCRVISLLLGKKIFMPLLGHRYPILKYATVAPLVENLNLVIGGGLHARGWTKNDIDVNGQKEDVPEFASRLQQKGIPNPVHYCGPLQGHSHLYCAYNGIKLAFTGKGY